MVTAVVLTKNEEKNIKACLETLKFCEEIIVIDDNSEDKTKSIAQKLGTTVITHSLQNDFAMQRNFALEQAKGDWVFFVDADERVSIELAVEIKEKVDNDSVQGFYLFRKDTLWGKELVYGETGNIKLLRIGRKDAGMWQGAVHETWLIKGQTETLTNPLQHFPHQTVTEILTEINRYTDIRAKELYEKKVSEPMWAIFVYPKTKFFMNYFVKRGFKDGIPGFLHAMFMSFHSFLVRGKLWLLWNR